MNPYLSKAKSFLDKGLAKTKDAYDKNLFQKDLTDIANKSTGVGSFTKNFTHSVTGGHAKDVVVDHFGAYRGHPTWNMADKVRVFKANRVLKGFGPDANRSAGAVGGRMRASGFTRAEVSEYHARQQQAGRMRTLSAGIAIPALGAGIAVAHSHNQKKKLNSPYINQQVQWRNYQ